MLHLKAALPANQIQNQCCTKEKYNIEQALVIGDREIDKEAGQAAGFDTLLVDGKILIEIVK